MLFDHTHYVPVLKWKRGEQKALELLDTSLKNSLTPLIEITPVPWDSENDAPKKTIDKHLDKIGEQVKKSWNNSAPVFVDPTELEYDDDLKTINGDHFLKHIIEDIENNGTPVIPVTRNYHFQSYFDALKEMFIKYNRGICIRIKSEELNDLSKLKEDIDSLLDSLNAIHEETDIILDYGHISPSDLQSQVNSVLLSLIRIPYIQKWRTLTMVSTSIPTTLREVKTGSIGEIARKEWIIMKGILAAKNGIVRVPTFGDYIIDNPSYSEFDPVTMQVAATIRYTTNKDKFVIFRGTSTKKDGFSQFHNLAKKVTAHPDYSGKSYSYGDRYTYECANRTDEPGSHETWRRAGVNHHLTLTIKELSNLHAVSTTY